MRMKMKMPLLTNWVNTKERSLLRQQPLGVASVPTCSKVHGNMFQQIHITKLYPIKDSAKTTANWKSRIGSRSHLFPKVDPWTFSNDRLRDLSVGFRICCPKANGSAENIKQYQTGLNNAIISHFYPFYLKSRSGFTVWNGVQWYCCPNVPVESLKETHKPNPLPF